MAAREGGPADHKASDQHFLGAGRIALWPGVKAGGYGEVSAGIPDWDQSPGGTWSVADGGDEPGKWRGTCPEDLIRARCLAFRAGDQPFLWVETVGTDGSTTTIFILPPPPIYLRDEAVSTRASVEETAKMDGRCRNRV